MEKVKKLISEHKYGLFCFLFLVLYILIYSMPDFDYIDDGVTYSIYAVDFSVGFCTRLLPGAVFNLFFDDINPAKAQYYIGFLVFLCCVFFSFFANRLLKSFAEEQKRYGLIFIWLCLCIFIVSSISGHMFSILDLHWYVSAAFFFVCISDKKFYIFVPLTFAALIMVQYASLICYVPMFALLILYKAAECKDKKEKSFLLSVFFASCIVAIGLTVYMLMFETSNVRMSMNEFIGYLKEKGVTDYLYYVYPFFRTAPEGIELIATQEEINTYNFIEVDMSQPKIMIMIQMILQQIQYNFIMAYHYEFLLDLSIFLPFIFFTYKMLYFMLKDKNASGLHKFVYLLTMILLVFTIAAGFLFSTDTARWFGHGVITVAALTTYYISCNDGYRQRLCKEMKKIPLGLIILYGLILCDFNFINFY